MDINSRSYVEHFANKLTVKQICIDDLYLPNVGFIKIDEKEGHGKSKAVARKLLDGLHNTHKNSFLKTRTAWLNVLINEKAKSSGTAEISSGADENHRVRLMGLEQFYLHHR